MCLCVERKTRKYTNETIQNPSGCLQKNFLASKPDTGFSNFFQLSHQNLVQKIILLLFTSCIPTVVVKGSHVRKKPVKTFLENKLFIFARYLYLINLSEYSRNKEAQVCIQNTWITHLYRSTRLFMCNILSTEKLYYTEFNLISKIH